MKPDRPVREFGQRSLPPPFFSASKRYSVLGYPGEEKEHRVPKEGTRLKSSKQPVSLSDFLDRKLARTNSTSTPSVQEKHTSFSSIRSLNARVGIKSDGACNDSTLNRAVFKKLNCTANEEGSTCCGFTEEILQQSNKDGHESRKRKNPLAVSPGYPGQTEAKWHELLEQGSGPECQHDATLSAKRIASISLTVSSEFTSLPQSFLELLYHDIFGQVLHCMLQYSITEDIFQQFMQNLKSNIETVHILHGEYERYSSSKYLVVLGDDPKPRQKGRKKKFTDMKPKPLFNHYANGNGSWDCDREGVDNEEVGCNETWEGMGSTTLGGLEWH